MKTLALRRMDFLCAAFAVMIGHLVLPASSFAAPEAPPSGGAVDEVQVYLLDGSIFTGTLSVKTIDIQTEFGNLKIPVSRIIRITPGLVSHKKLSATLKTSIEDLGDANYKKREKAQKVLLALGPRILSTLSKFSSDKNAERKLRVTDLIAKLTELVENDEDEDEDLNFGQGRNWNQQDLIQTPDFTIAGKIALSTLAINSKHGALNVSIEAISVCKSLRKDSGPLFKSLPVPCQSLVQRGLKSSKLRVKVGDTITVSAKGNMTMTPWGNTRVSTPEGNAQCSTYTDPQSGQKFNSGTLIARIGTSGPLIKVGTSAVFVVKKSGTLHFGVTMYNSYASSNYYYPGTYKLKIKVERRK